MVHCLEHRVGEGFYLTMDRELILVLEQVYLFKNWWDFFCILLIIIHQRQSYEIQLVYVNEKIFLNPPQNCLCRDDVSIDKWESGNLVGVLNRQN